MKKFRHFLCAFLSLVMVVTLTPAAFFTPQETFAEATASSDAVETKDVSVSPIEKSSTEWSLSQTSMTITDYGTEYQLVIDCDTSVYNSYDFYATSSDSSVVYTDDVYQNSSGSYYVSLYKRGVGNANITVSDYDDNCTCVCSVTAEASDAVQWSLSSSSMSVENYNTTYKLRINCDTSYYDTDDFDVYCNSYDIDIDQYWYPSEDSSGYYYSFTKQSVGTAVITVTNNAAPDEADASLTCTVTCKALPLTLSTSSIKFNKSNYGNYSYVDNYYMYYNDYSLESVKSSKPSVATVSMLYDSTYGYYVSVYAKKPGKTTLTIKDSLGRSKTVSVTVEKSYVKKNLKYNTSAYYEYGEKFMYVYSKPGAKVTVKLDGKKYKKKVNSSGYAKIKVGTNHKYNKKFKVTAKYLGAKVKYSGRSTTYSYVYSVYTPSYYYSKFLQVTVRWVHKGDVVYVKCGGKTYSKKITEDASSISLTFKLKKYIYDYTSFKVTIKNKYKQKLYTNTYYYS
ncbi:MAG: hypothetical protein K5840_00935 [Eubacterium sp.]|nr:hypothetical protein [Eubacterium sp.]